MNCPGASLGLQNIGIKRKICWFFIDQILWLFHPIFLSLQLAYFTIKNEMMLDSRDINDEEYIENNDKQQNLMLYLKLYKKMELNLENIFQLTGKIILIAIVDSQTRTTQGMVIVIIWTPRSKGGAQHGGYKNLWFSRLDLVETFSKHSLHVNDIIFVA